MRDPRATMPAAAWLRRHAPLIAQGSRVLDLAAGQGRNARFLAALGHDVVAVDRDADALSALAGVARVATRVLDLETPSWPLAGERFDAIVVNHYLHRPSFDAMHVALSDSGVLIYETSRRKRSVRTAVEPGVHPRRRRRSSAHARAAGGRVLRGRCVDREGSSP
jgi:SAM-dependent methyltransferase